jgi:hypothetical protein
VEQRPDISGEIREAARVMNAAGTQVDLALRDSQAAVDKLGASLEKLARLLAEDLADPRMTSRLAQLRGEMVQAVTGLQFYDRMTQHLTHVRDYLARGAQQLGSVEGEPDARWSGVHGALADRLLSETHRMYLGQNFPADYMSTRGALSREERGASSPGDIDLF